MTKVIKIIKTCEGCPAQWEGRTDDNRGVYVRYRWGNLTVSVSTDEADAVSGPNIYVQKVGESGWEGEMSYEELKAITAGEIEWPDHEWKRQFMGQDISSWTHNYWHTSWEYLETYYRDDQILWVEDIAFFTYKEICDDINKCLSLIRKKVKGVPEERIKELSTIMNRFTVKVANDESVIEYTKVKDAADEDLPLFMCSLGSPAAKDLLEKRLKEISV